MSDDETPATWISLTGPATGGGTHIQVARRDGRWAVTGAYVHGPEITQAMLQAVPVAQIERMLNLAPMELFDLKTVIKYGGFSHRLLDDPDGRLTLAQLRETADGAPAEFRILEPSNRPKLGRPDGSNPDAFYERVADAYREYAPITSKPGTRIAEEAGVPLGTARGWIREARRRGKLPPGRKGKAG